MCLCPPFGERVLPSPLPVAPDAYHPGDRWLPGETAWRPQRQVYPSAHAGSSGDVSWGHRESSGRGEQVPVVKPCLYSSSTSSSHKNPSSESCLSPASPVQVGPSVGKATRGAHTDEGSHHAGPMALHQTQPAAGRARTRIHQLQPLLPPG